MRRTASQLKPRRLRLLQNLKESCHILAAFFLYVILDLMKAVCFLLRILVEGKLNFYEVGL